jgi:hypothetical protein
LFVDTDADPDRLAVCRILCGMQPGQRTPHDGRYLVAYDPDTEDGVLALTSTARLDQALVAPAIDFMRMWRAVSPAPAGACGRPSEPAPDWPHHRDFAAHRGAPGGLWLSSPWCWSPGQRTMRLAERSVAS